MGQLIKVLSKLRHIYFASYNGKSQRVSQTWPKNSGGRNSILRNFFFFNEHKSNWAIFCAFAKAGWVLVHVIFDLMSFSFFSEIKRWAIFDSSRTNRRELWTSSVKLFTHDLSGSNNVTMRTEICSD